MKHIEPNNIHLRGRHVEINGYRGITTDFAARTTQAAANVAFRARRLAGEHHAEYVLNLRGAMLIIERARLERAILAANQGAEKAKLTPSKQEN